MKIKNRPLYLVTDRTNLTDRQFLTTIEQACKSGVDLVQLREKQLSGREYYELAQAVKQITDRYQLPLIIDDRLDIAQAVNAAGVHLGQNDLPVKVARQILGADKIIGATTKTLPQALEAEKESADYLGVGAIFPTQTHVKTVHTSVATLSQIRQNVSIPVYAIGGLKAHNVAAVKPAHVAGVAVVSAIMQAADPIKATQELRQAVLAAL
ncbi:thiamine phosphate synthase [Lactobacillus sp. ESL0731]|uniref:thiamine phosphate synthase n=1 Tax=unclassified Lactobacillus TaxID=2620435 RepID=UPI0023F76A80|nr:MULTISPECIES: thiamine phosphate synthase [unclassified Lactobacillus]WEV51219.1 thiamine phosphate synthase [Lactobacillus sp. ESL0700]WEV62349.1 thiamine phosphate synthase [Lactobacillus sp. ESL0731]